MNWSEYDYITSCNYKDIEYYGSINMDFEDCRFNNVLFYWNIFNVIDFKNCTFENCTFAGVSFDSSSFIKCVIKKCTFTKGKIGLHCTSDNSYLVDCDLDQQSLKNNPLIIYKEVCLLKEIKKELYITFKTTRPKLAVDDHTHCLSCNETQETHEKIKELKDATVDDFQLCYMAIESFSEEAFMYYMPKLLELLLIGKENNWGIFKIFFVGQLVPNKFGNRFKHYNKAQTKLIITVLEFVYNKYNTEDEIWDYNIDMMTNSSDYKDLLKYCKEALDFWKGK